MASGAPHLCYWRLGRLDRHTPRTNDPATWRNIRHLESKTSRLRRSATRGIRHDTQHVKSQNMSKLPSCIKTTMLDTFYTDSNGTFCLSAVRRHMQTRYRGGHTAGPHTMARWRGACDTDTMMACFAGAAPDLQLEFFSERKIMFSLPLEAKLGF